MTFRRSAALALVAAIVAPKRARARCTNIDECREIGDRRSDELEAAKGVLVDLGQGLRYREARVGTGAEVREDSIVEVTFEVRATVGDYIYSYGRGRPDMPKSDFGETYRVQLGQRAVPVGVERAMLGMRQGGIRTVELSPQWGFQTSDWRPTPTNYSGQRRMERFRQLLTGNGSQPGYNAAILFEVEVVRVVKP